MKSLKLNYTARTLQTYLPYRLVLGIRWHNHSYTFHWCVDIALTPDSFHRACYNFLHKNDCHRLSKNEKKKFQINTIKYWNCLLTLFDIRAPSVELVQWFFMDMLIILKDIDDYLNPTYIFKILIVFFFQFFLNNWHVYHNCNIW